MIARVWRGVIAQDRQADYVAYVDDTGVAEYRRAEGCRVSMILTRDLDAEPAGVGTETPRVEVIAFSVWDSEAAIREFTGPDIDAMVLYPEDRDYLLEPPSLVHHRVDSFSLPTIEDPRPE